MIKRFHALYVGQIDLDNVGLNGTPANDRRYSNERLTEVFETSRRVAKVMDELGYYCFWAAEHHFQHEGYECIPNLIQWGLWLATQTKQLKFGAGFNILPMWHPIRLAEDYAMADIVTDGRVVMGVGRGYHTREVETFGAPLLDADANRDIFVEGLDLLLKCFNEESFHHEGQVFHRAASGVPYRKLRPPKEITCRPAAESTSRSGNLHADRQRPHSTDLMAQKGLKAMVTLNSEKILDDVIQAFHQESLLESTAVEAGQQETWYGAPASISPTARKKAIRRLEPAHDERYLEMVRAVRFCALRRRARPHLGQPRRAGDHPRPCAKASKTAEGLWFCGRPDQVIKNIKSIEARYPGLEDFMIHWARRPVAKPSSPSSSR